MPHPGDLTVTQGQREHGGVSTKAANLRPASEPVTTPSVEFPKRWAIAAAGLVPTLVYIWTASGHAHWFDTGEFVAAAADLGIAHPPGHPLAVMVFGAAHLLPIGALAFRVAVVCAFLAGAASSALFTAFHHTLFASGVVRRAHVAPAAFAATWWAAGSTAWWVQAVRPEVYALQAFLLCVVFERLCWMAARSVDDVRPFYQASFVLGLGLSNHHYTAFLAIPASAVLLTSIVRRHGAKTLIVGGACTVLGLLPYLFLPLRSIGEPFLNLGAPTTPAKIWWVVTAKAFQKSAGMEQRGVFSDRLADVFLALAENSHIAVMLIALLGLYLMLRLPTARRLALFWASVLVVYAFGRAVLGFVRGNPDALGYMMPATAAITLFAAFAIAVVLAAIADLVPNRQRAVQGAAVALSVFSLLQFARSAPQSSLRDFVDSDVLDDALRRNLPANAVVFAQNPQTVFRYWGGEAEEWTRPDVTFVPMPFLTYPGYVEALIDRTPELKPILRHYLVHGKLNGPPLQALAAHRPVLLEMDPRTPTALYQDLVPEQLYFRLRPGGVTDNDERNAAQHHQTLWSQIYNQLTPDEAHPTHKLDEHTEAQLLWRHYNDALYFLSWDDREAASNAVDRGLALESEARELVQLRQALDTTPPDQTIDVHAFRLAP